MENIQKKEKEEESAQPFKLERFKNVKSKIDNSRSNNENQQENHD